MSMEKEKAFGAFTTQILNNLGGWGKEQSSSCRAGGFFFYYFGTKPVFVFVFVLETVQDLFNQ